MLSKCGFGFNVGFFSRCGALLHFSFPVLFLVLFLNEGRLQKKEKTLK